MGTALALAIVAARLPRRKRVGLSFRAPTVRVSTVRGAAFVGGTFVEVLVTAGGVVNVTGAPLLDP